LRRGESVDQRYFGLIFGQIDDSVNHPMFSNKDRVVATPPP
jgi:hypothetical protein